MTTKPRKPFPPDPDPSPAVMTRAERIAEFDRRRELEESGLADGGEDAADGVPTSVVPVVSLSPNPDNPRGSIDFSDPEFVGLQTSVASLGVAQALTVCTREAFLRHHPQHSDAITQRYVVVAGHRRLQAARLAGLNDVPVLVNDSAAEHPLMWAVAENLQRVGLNPMQEARTLSVLTDKPPLGKGLSQTAVAQGIGKTQGFVSQRIALLKLLPQLQNKVLSGELKVKRAALLAKAAQEQQAEVENALQKLVPSLQAEIDGGKLTDLRLALAVAALPSYVQFDARLNKGVPTERPHKPQKGMPGTPAHGSGQRDGAAVGIPPQISGGRERPDAATSPVIVLVEPSQIARELAQHLTPAQLTELTELLLDLAAAG